MSSYSQTIEIAEVQHRGFVRILRWRKAVLMAPNLLKRLQRNSGPTMTLLGRRKHSRFLLTQPIDGNLRVREEVAIEEWNENELVILSPQPCRANERLTLEFPSDNRPRLRVSVRESRPAVVADGAIRHRLRLSIEQHGQDDKPQGGRDL